jgi:hypothetical protein
MSHQLERHRPDTDKGVRFDYTLRAGSQYIEVFSTTVSASISQQHSTTPRTHHYWFRGGDMDARCDDWHRF